MPRKTVDKNIMCYEYPQLDLNATNGFFELNQNFGILTLFSISGFDFPNISDRC